MRFRRVFCSLGIFIILALINLFLVKGKVEGQCIPGYQYPDLGFWVSAGGNKVPYSLWPPEVQAQSGGGYNYATVIPKIHPHPNDWCWDDGSACFIGDVDPSGTWNAYGTAYIFGCHRISFGYLDPRHEYSWICNHIEWGLFEYDTGANRDYDCDWIYDSQDTNPGTPDPNDNAEIGNPACNAQNGI